MCPHFQVQGGIKMTKRAHLSPPSSSSLFPPGRTGDSPFLNKAILPHPIHMLYLDSSIWNTKTRIFWSQTAPLPLTFVAILDRRNWPVRSQYTISANLYFSHLPLSSDTTPHQLMLQNQTPLMTWVVWDPPAGAFTGCSGLLWSPNADGLHPARF
jgi:hypothetical protein